MRTEITQRELYGVPFTLLKEILKLNYKQSLSLRLVVIPGHDGGSKENGANSGGKLVARFENRSITDLLKAILRWRGALISC